MNIQKPLKSVSTILASLLVFVGVNSFSEAETTLNQAGNTYPASSVATVVKHNEIKTEEEAEAGESDWWKAEITDYDSSLSLISYELIPETTQTTSVTTETTVTTTTTTVTSEMNNSPSDVPYVSGSNSYITPDQQEYETANPSSGEFAFTTYGWGH